MSKEGECGCTTPTDVPNERRPQEADVSDIQCAGNCTSLERCARLGACQMVSDRLTLTDEECAKIAARELQIAHWKFSHPTDSVEVTLAEIMRAIRAGYAVAAEAGARERGILRELVDLHDGDNFHEGHAAEAWAAARAAAKEPT